VVNSLCDRLLLYGYLEELHEIDRTAAKLVIAEIEQDAVKAQPAGRDETAESLSPALQLQTASYQPEGSGGVEERLAQLEAGLAGLRRTVQRERSLLRKAILMQLDMDEVYSETGEDSRD
jgi:hypothetical protein